MSNMVKTVIFLKDVKDYSRLRKTEQKYYKKHAPLLIEEPPASTFIQPRSVMGNPSLLVGMDVTGVISPDRPGWEVKKYPMYYGGVKQAYSKSVIVGNLLFPSGFNAIDPDTGKVESDTLEGQMVIIHDKIKAALEEAGSSINNVVKTFHLLKERRPRTMWKAELEYYQKHARVLIEENPPASTFMQLSSLTALGSLAETDITAAISRHRPGWEVKKGPLFYGDVKRYFSRYAAVGNLLFISGNAGGTPLTGEIQSDVMEDQMEQSLNRTRMVMEEAGSSMNNIIKIWHLFKNLEDIPRIRDIELAYYKKHAPLLLEEPPVSTFIQPYALANPRYLVELDSTGVIS